MATEELIMVITQTEDYYEILGTSRNVSPSELTKSYRKLALKLHPDKCTLPGGDDAFKKLSNAFSILKDPEQRAHYDKFGSSESLGHTHSRDPFHGGVPFDPDDLFREIFKDNPNFAQSGGFKSRRPGGFPGGVKFSFDGGRGGGNPIQWNIPQPLKSFFHILTALVPTPFLVLGCIFMFMYLASTLISLMLRNFVLVLALIYAPLPSQLKSWAWPLFFSAGLLGYL